MMNPEQIADYVEERAITHRAQTIMINRIARSEDESHKWPINGRFNATERAIRRVRQRFSEMGEPCVGLHYTLALDDEISRIVNNEHDWRATP